MESVQDNNASCLQSIIAACNYFLDISTTALSLYNSRKPDMTHRRAIALGGLYLVRGDVIKIAPERGVQRSGSVLAAAITPSVGTTRNFEIA